MKCSNCGAEIPDSALFCGSCGTRVTAPAPGPVPAEACRQCQAPLKAGALFCPNCGTPVSPVAAPTEAVCPQCAAKVKPEAVFCPNCGSKMKNQAPAVRPASAFAAPQAQPVTVNYSYPAAAPVQPRRKRKGPLVALALLLVLLIAGGGVYAFFGSNIKRLVMGPKASYLAVEGQALKQNAADLAANLVEYGNKNSKKAKGGFNLGLKFDLNADALGIDAATAAALKNITVNSRSVYDRSGATPKFFNKLSLAAADKDLLKIEALYDQEQTIISFPEILQKSIVVTADEMAGAMGSTGLDSGEATASLSALNLLISTDLGINEAKLKSSFNSIVDILLKHIDKADFQTGQTLKAGDVSATYDLYTITIEKESARQMLIEIFGKLKDDQEFYNLVSKLSSLSTQTSGGSSQDIMTFAAYQASLQGAIDDLKADQSSEDFTLVQKVYVDQANAVAGRELTVKNVSGTELLHLLYAHPVNGSREAVLFQFKADQDAFEFASSYTVKDGRKTGQARITSAGAEVLSATYTDLVKKTVGTSDRLLGKLALKFSGAAGSQSTISAPAALNFSGSEKGSAYIMAIEVPKMVTVNLEYTEVAAADITFPAYAANTLVKASDTKALNALMTPDVQAKFMAIIQQLGLMPAQN